MSTRKLAAHVHVLAEDGVMHVFGPDDELPEWAEKAITNRAAFADDEEHDGIAEPGPRRRSRARQ